MTLVRLVAKVAAAAVGKADGWAAGRRGGAAKGAGG